MTAATLAGQPDPFASVLKSLGSTAARVEALVPPIATAQEIVTVMADVLDDLDRVPALLTGLRQLVTGLRGVLVLLEAVPIVNVAAGSCAAAATSAERLLRGADKSLKQVRRSIITPGRAAFHDLRLGLAQAHDVVHSIRTTVPGYVNTLEILRFMGRIAAQLTELLQDSQPAEQLRALLRTLDSVREDVSAALQPLTVFLDGIGTVVEAVSTALGTAFREMESTMLSVRTGLNEVEDLFGPIVDAFTAVTSAIAPVRWALDALSWIFDKVCEPVISAILHATGLDQPLDELVREVEMKLGIGPIITLVQSNLQGRDAGAWQAKGGRRATASGRNAWKGMDGALRKYNTRDSAGLRNNIALLVGAIAGTPVDPTRPAEIPDWPGQPGVRVPQMSAGARTAGAGASAAIRALPLQRALRGRRIARGFLSLAAIPNPVAPAPRPDIPGVLARTATSGVPALDALRSLAMEARGDLAGAAALGPALFADLASYDAARTLPAAFRASMVDLSGLLKDGVRLLDFVKQFGFLTPLIEDLKAPLAEQASGIGEILTACDRLGRSGAVMDAAIGQVVKAVPSAGVFTAALDYMDSVALGAASLSSAMAQARELDAGLNGAHKAALDDLQEQLEASAAAVAAQTREVESLASKALAAGTAVHATLQAYAAALRALSGDADVLSDTLPDLGEAVHLLNVLVSILDPLSALLHRLDCLDGGDPAKQGAAVAVQLFRTQAAGLISGQDEALRGLFGAVLSSVLHTDRLRADIQAIDALVQREQAGFDQAREALAAALAALPAAMAPARAFPAHGEGSAIAVSNLFVDPSFASRAHAVFGAVQEAARNAGLISGSA